MEKYLENVIHNQGLIIQILASFIEDDEKRKEIYEYGSTLSKCEVVADE
jgi:hypothetical protein